MIKTRLLGTATFALATVGKIPTSTLLQLAYIKRGIPAGDSNT